MAQTNVSIAIAKTSVRTLAAGILMAAGFLTVSIAVPVVASSPAFAKPSGVVKGAKRIRGRISRGRVRRACKSAGKNGFGWGTNPKGPGQSGNGGYGCENKKTGSRIDCNSKGKCVGGNTKKKRD